MLYKRKECAKIETKGELRSPPADLNIVDVLPGPGEDGPLGQRPERRAERGAAAPRGPRARRAPRRAAAASQEQRGCLGFRPSPPLSRGRESACPLERSGQMRLEQKYTFTLELNPKRTSKIDIALNC